MVGRSGGDGEDKNVLRAFLGTAVMVTNLWILVCASIFGIKGTQIFRSGKK